MSPRERWASDQGKCTSGGDSGVRSKYAEKASRKTPITFSLTGSGRNRRRETGMVHSRELKVSARVEKRAEAMRTGRVEVKVVPCCLHACRRLCVVLAEKVRE